MACYRSVCEGDVDWFVLEGAFGCAATNSPIALWMSWVRPLSRLVMAYLSRCRPDPISLMPARLRADVRCSSGHVSNSLGDPAAHQC